MTFANRESVVPEVPRILGLPRPRGRPGDPNFGHFIDFSFDFLGVPFLGPIGAPGEARPLELVNDLI